MSRIRLVGTQAQLAARWEAKMILTIQRAQGVTAVDPEYASRLRSDAALMREFIADLEIWESEPPVMNKILKRRVRRIRIKPSAARRMCRRRSRS